MDTQYSRVAHAAAVEHGAPDDTLSSRRLVLFRLAALVVVTLALALFAAGIAAYYRKLSTPPAPVAMRLHNLGLSAGVNAAYLTSVVVAFALVCFGVAALIAWRRPDRPMVLFVSLFLVLLGAVNAPLAAALTEQYPGWSALVNLAFGLMGTCFILFLFLFPDGRFVPGRMRLPVVILAAALLLAMLLPALSEIGYLLLLAGFTGGVVAQIYRYRRVSNHTQRQQTRWVVFGGALALAGQLGTALLGTVSHWSFRWDQNSWATIRLT
ncbi:MAG: hypothetical protein M3380_16655 [Chloroflexota bacterium]|nr:hypothetical protein [Chloroflexota bacterium]